MKGALRPISLLFCCALPLALGILFHHRERTFPQRSFLAQREIATRVLGEYLANQFRGRPVLVVANPFTEKKGLNPQIYDVEEAEINGLRKGLGKGASIKVSFPKLRRGADLDPHSVYVDPKTTTPLSFLVADGAFDGLLGGNADRTLVVSLIGLPARLDRVQAWKVQGGPQFALVLPDWRMVGDKEAIRTAFRSGKVVAAVMNKPGAAAEDFTLNEPYHEEFARRFLLVTAENVDSLTLSFPQAF